MSCATSCSCLARTSSRAALPSKARVSAALVASSALISACCAAASALRHFCISSSYLLSTGAGSGTGAGVVGSSCFGVPHAGGGRNKPGGIGDQLCGVRRGRTVAADLLRRTGDWYGSPGVIGARGPMGDAPLRLGAGRHARRWFRMRERISASSEVTMFRWSMRF